MKLIQQHHTLRLHELNISLFLPYLTTFRLPGLHSVEWWQYQCIPEHRKAFGTKRRWLSPAFSWSDWEKWQTPLVRFTDHLVPHFKVTGRQLLFMYNCCAFRTHQVIIRHVCVCVCVYIYIYICMPNHAVAQLDEALRYKPEGRGFDSRWCHCNFSLT